MRSLLEVAAEVRENNVKHPTQRGEHVLDNAPAYVTSNNAPCEGGEDAVTELLLSSFVYRSWRLSTAQKALLFESRLFFFFFLMSSQQTIHIFGVKENEDLDEWGGLWRDVSVCADDKLGSVGRQRADRDRARLSAPSAWESSVGKRQASVWEMASF